jgi:hypothetical protein
MGNADIDRRISKLFVKWKWRAPRPAPFRGKSQGRHLCNMLGDPHNESGCGDEENNLFLPGLELQSLRP